MKWPGGRNGAGSCRPRQRIRTGRLLRVRVQWHEHATAICRAKRGWPSEAGEARLSEAGQVQRCATDAGNAAQRRRMGGRYRTAYHLAQESGAGDSTPERSRSWLVGGHGWTWTFTLGGV